MQYLAANKVAFIAGGSSGIGLAFARQFAKRGLHVWLVARRLEQLAAAVEEVKACRLRDDQVIGSTTVDVTDPLQVEAAVAEVTRALGTPDVVINSAGFAQPGYFHEQELRIFHDTMNVNYFGALNVIRAVLPGMRQRGSGLIVNICSESGFLGLFGYTAYSASKFALAGFSDALRPELKAMGVQLSIIYPPDVDTPQLEYETRFQPPELRSLAPLRTVITADKVVEKSLKAIEKGQYMILPVFDSWLMYFLTHFLGRGAYPLLDMIMKTFWKLNHGSPKAQNIQHKED